MDLSSIIAELKREQERIGHAIASLLGGSTPSTKGDGRKEKRGRKGGMSAEGRRNISLAMKRRWAERRGKGATTSSVKAKAAKAAPMKDRRGHALTPAGRKRLSEMMKQRWAARKKASD